MKFSFEFVVVRVVSSVAVVAALASACGGGGDDDGGETPNGEPEAGAGGSSGSSSASAGNGGTTASGGTAGSQNAVGSGITEGGAGGETLAGGTSGSGDRAGNGGSSPDKGEAGNGGSAMLDDSGKDSLNGADGITGVASGTLFARSMNVQVEVITPEYLLLEAEDGANGNWTLRIPAKVGVYSCDAQAGADVASITLNDRGTHTIRGTTTQQLGGSCALEVTSITGPIEGRFVASLVGVLGAVHPVTSGYFHFADSPIGDCSNAEDPGVSEDEFAATLSVTKIETAGKVPWKCGENGKLPATRSVAGADPEFSFRGSVGDRMWTLRIDGMRATGTFDCGADGVALLIDSTWGGENGGSCTIDVTEYGPDGVVGTYVAALWNGVVAQHSTVHLEGSFRTKPTYP